MNENLNNIKGVYIETRGEDKGNVERNRKEGLTGDTWRRIEERRHLKADVDRDRKLLAKRNAVQEYQGKAGKGSLSKRQEGLIYQVATDAKEAASKGDLNKLYQTILRGRKPNQSKRIRNKEGDLLG